MLTTLASLLEAAERGNYAVIAPDFPNLYAARILLEQAEVHRAPLILSYATIFKPMRDVQRYDRFIEIVRREAEQVTVPVALHLDHATRVEDIVEAIDVGFTSVMIDASAEPYERNLEQSRRAADLARPAGVSVEAELGRVGSDADYLAAGSTEPLLTDVDEAAAFATATGIDALAIAIGTVHGVYSGEPKIDYGRLEALHRRLTIPLVLHGSSGLGEERIQRCISLGIRKINVFTDLTRSMLEEGYQELGRQRSNPIKAAAAQASGLRRVIDEYLRISGSVGAAPVA